MTFSSRAQGFSVWEIGPGAGISGRFVLVSISCSGRLGQLSGASAVRISTGGDVGFGGFVDSFINFHFFVLSSFCFRFNSILSRVKHIFSI